MDAIQEAAELRDKPAGDLPGPVTLATPLLIGLALFAAWWIWGRD